MALSPEKKAEIQSFLETSPYSDTEIAKRVGCSQTTVWRIRTAREEKTRAEMRKDYGVEEPVYRGGGEW